MSIDESLKKLEAILTNAEKSQLWGTVELQFNAGELALIRESKVTKFQTRRGANRDERNQF